MESLLLDPFSSSSVQNYIKWLQLLKFVGLVGIPNSGIQDCSKIFTHALKLLFNFSSSQNDPSRFLKEAAIGNIIKKSNGKSC